MFYASPAPPRNKGKRQSGIFSQVLYRTLSYRESCTVSPDIAELSTEVSAPGVLKVFGGNICAGTHYKSVLATTNSSAEELVKEALERYAVSKQKATQYVLCDVIGRLVGAHKQWVPDYLRVLRATDKPLLIQDLWKPKDGYSRRLELRKRSEVEELAAKEVDTVTAGINAQARRLQRNRAKDARCQVTSTPPPLRRTLSETSLTLPPAQEEDARRPYATIPERRADASVLPEERAAIIRHSLYYSAHLLLLQGYSHEQDSLVYLLNREQHTFGFRTPSSKPSIILSAPDILPLHCTIRKVKPPRCAAFRSEKKLVVEPIPGASVSVNFSKVDRTTILQHGDLLGFGAYYLLLYKDPAKAQPLPDQALARLRSLSSQPDLICRMCGRHLREKTSSSKKKESASCSRGGNLITRKHLNLEYERQLEDSLVNKILTLIEPGGDDHKLTPSFLLCLCIQHSASCFTPGDFGQLLLKVTRRIQRMVWERTKDLAEKQSDQQDPTSLSITDLIPDLKHILFWMSNSTELLYFIQQSSPRYLQSMEDELDIKGSKESVFSNTITASEEAMTVLEEVIMYTFQQCVYYISKCLYMMLPALLEGGIAPRDLQSFSPLLPDVQQVIIIYQTTLDLLQQFEVHQDMAAQMFSYLFFFSNTLLFNQLMERGTSPGFFSCTRGVKIRANLKLLLSWCQDVGYGATAKQFFSKLLSVTELLTTPSSQLTQMSWGCIRAEFPSLSHSQLLYVLNHSLNTSEPCTIPLWMPGHEENPVACENIMETFDNHPPIILPSEGFKVKLEGNSMHENIYRHLLYIRHFLWGLRRSPSEPGELQNEISTNPSVRSTAQCPKWDSGTAAHAANNSQNGKHSDSEADGRDISLLSCSPSEERLKEKLRHLHLQSMVTKDTAIRAGMQPLDSSCLLTPPNTPLMPEPDGNISSQLNGISRSPVDIRREELLASRTGEENSDCPAPSTCSEEDFCHVFVVEMEKGTMGLGMGLIDGLQTPLNSPGIYIRTLIPNSPAASDGRLAIGDRILAVNGSSLIGATYRSAVELIRSGGKRLRFLIAKTEEEIAEKIRNGFSC